MQIVMSAVMEWCPWTDYYFGLNCSTTQRRSRCCFSKSREPSHSNCSVSMQTRPRPVRCNNTMTDASRESALDLNWYLIFIVGSIVIFICCIIFRIWHLFHRCLNSDDVIAQSLPPSRALSYVPRRPSGASSSHTLNLRDYAEGMELSDFAEDSRLDSPRPLVVPSAPALEPDLPPTYDDVAPRGETGGQVEPAVVNFPGFSFNVHVDQPPAYETLTPPPNYEDI